MQLRLAVAADAPAITALVDRAYRGYLPRMTGRPRPMDDDFADKIAGALVVVADDGGIVGLIILEIHPDHLFIDNVAVDPCRQGSGLGRLLLGHAEDVARQHGLAELRLYTNAVMTENVAIYTHLGYREDDRRTEHGFTRVFMSKRLGAAS